MNFQYWLVTKALNENETQEVALVRVCRGIANVVAGDQSMAYDFHPTRDYRNKGLFVNGKPVESDEYIFQHIRGVYPSHPFVSDMIKNIGPPVWDKREKDAKAALEKSRSISRGLASRASRPEDFDEQVYALHKKGVKVSHMVEKFGVTDASIRRAIQRAEKSGTRVAGSLRA